MTVPLYRQLASLVSAYHSCLASNSPTVQEWANIHRQSLENLNKHLPSGRGFDSGSFINLSDSSDTRLEFYTSFHHIEEGFYDGWTEHTIIVTPSFEGINIDVITTDGEDNRNDIHTYIGDTFYDSLIEEI